LFAGIPKSPTKREQEGLTGRRNGTAMASVDLKVVLLGMHPAERERET
jgi:hypothetical protein